MQHAQLFHNGAGNACLQLRAQAQADDIPPQLVVIVLDCSGSMAGPKLAAAKRAVQFCLAHLRANVDSLALVTFDHNASLLLPPTAVTGDNSARLHATVASIQPGGSTNLEAALVLALAQVPAGGEAHVILATDGLPNIGLSDTTSLQALICDHSSGKTVRLDTAGFGADHNDQLLCTLASQGVYTFLEHAEGVCDWAATRLGHLLSTVARNIRIDLPGATNIRIATGMDVTGSTVRLPQLAAEASKHVLFQLSSDDPSGASGTVAYQTVDGTEHTLTLAPATLDATLVVEQQQRWQFVDALLQARQLAEEQYLERARAVLERALGQATDPDLREQLQAMLELYRNTATYRTLGRQRSTETARGYAMEEETGGRSRESAFVTSSQRTLRHAAAHPGCWQWENDPVGAGLYVDFASELQQQLHAAQAAGASQIQVQIRGENYTLRLDANVQVNNRTQFVRNIRRGELSGEA